MKKIYLLLVAVSVIAVGCQQGNSSSQSHTEVPDEVKAQAVAARDALFLKLSGRLMEVVGSSGPAAAIEVCSKEAPGIAESIGEEHGVKIGRTALKLRNSSNRPPDWAAKLLSDSLIEPKFVTLSEEKAGALLPIRLQGQCMMCHGPKNLISPEVKKQLAEFYPQDQATGFKEGDLRGWFWVEVSTGTTGEDK